MTACNITGMKKLEKGAREEAGWIGVTAVVGLMRESTVFLGQIRKKWDSLLPATGGPLLLLSPCFLPLGTSIPAFLLRDFKPPPYWPVGNEFAVSQGGLIVAPNFK